MNTIYKFYRFKNSLLKFELCTAED